MKNSELIKKLQEFPADMEVAIFDVRQNFYHQDGDGVGIGIHTEFEIAPVDNDREDASESEKQFLSLTFSNEDYTENGGFTAVDPRVEKWEKLGKEIEECYVDENGDQNDDPDIDLGTIGEIAASAYGWL